MSDVTARGRGPHNDPSTQHRPAAAPAWHRLDGAPEASDEERPLPVGPLAGIPRVSAGNGAGGVQPAEQTTVVVAPAPQSNLAMWLVFAGVLLAVAVTLLAGARAGVFVIVGILVVGAGVRAFLPGPGPVGLTVRTRWTDVIMYLTTATVMGALAVTVPNI
ncbi:MULTISPECIES: DUF3017 domain-containing protein [unclassified Oerskovia]|uniref:DUF3017 domain-containing protein n=1 Tax=unclassified Oerskovia TaxID=2619021 RepID=UPI0006F75EBE|nr:MULTISPECIES: DUF3017 domain-containing protein [unclassified Oerskovia]KRC37711.1 hypothetical protein ASE15_06585 [Oerskovia sp. Root22]